MKHNTKEHKSGCPMVSIGWSATVPPYCNCNEKPSDSSGGQVFTHNTREVEEIAKMIDLYGKFCADPKQGNPALQAEMVMTTIIHQLQKAREEERERIYAVMSSYRDNANISGTAFEAGFNEGVDTVLKFLKEETLDKNNHSELDQDKQ